MATIIVIESADKLEPDSRNSINTNFAALNADVITKLPLAGGTMLGILNMNNFRITNLPEPVDPTDPARKVDLTLGPNTVTSSMIVAAAILESHLAHNNRRARVVYSGWHDKGTQIPQAAYVDLHGGTAGSATRNPAVIRDCCVTGVSLTFTNGLTKIYSFDYHDTTGHVDAGMKLGIFTNNGTDWQVLADGNVIRTLQSAGSGGVNFPVVATVEVEHD